MSKYRSGGAIVIDTRTLSGALDADGLAVAARSLERTMSRAGSRLRAFEADYVRVAGRLNGLSGALNALEASLSLSFAPVVTAAAPALTTLAELLTAATERASAFVAALTGQSVFLRAADAQSSYAASLSKSAGAARTLKRQLASFDRLDVLRADASGSGGLGSGAAPGSGLLELANVDDGILTFARALREMFARGDYDGVGEALAGGINAAIEKARALISWESIGGTVSRVVDGVCGVFNGLVAHIQWEALGDALGAGLDTLVRGANRLLAGLDLGAAGRAIGDALNGAVRAIDFAELGELTGRLLTAKLALVAEAVGRFDWSGMGERLAEGFGGMLGALSEALDGIDWPGLARSATGGLNRFIDRVDWRGAGAFLAARIDDVLAVIGAAVTNFHWGAAGGALSDAVNGLVRRVDWAAAGRALNKAVNGILDFGIRFLEGFDADALGDGIGKALEQVRWDQIAAKLWRLLSAAMDKLSALNAGPLATVRAAVEFVAGAGRSGGVLEGLQALLAPGAQVDVRLEKSGWSSIAAFVGTAVTVLTSLGKANWSTIAGYVGTAVTVLTSLGKRGWSSIEGFVGSAVQVLTSLRKSGWSTIQSFVGENATVKTALQRWGWSTIQSFVGENTTVKTALQKWGWSTIQSFVGEYATVKTALQRWGWSSVQSFVGEYATVRTALQRWGWSSLSDFVGSWVNVQTWLTNQGSNWSGGLLRWITGNAQGTISIVANLVAGAISGFQALFGGGRAEGGVITAGGRALNFAAGGIVSGGVAKYLSNVPHYAGGTTRAHGTVFVAGEAGPEIMGHINGRTEILNKSQIAQAIYGAVVSGMGQAVNALGRYIANHMTGCANAIVATIGNVGGLAALGGIEYRAPVMAGGTVAPYEVAAQLNRINAGLQSTLNANNEDLIQTIISVIGAQTSAVVAAIQAQGGRSDGGRGLSAQQIIDEINRRTQMFSASPLKGV